MLKTNLTYPVHPLHAQDHKINEQSGFFYIQLKTVLFFFLNFGLQHKISMNSNVKAFFSLEIFLAATDLVSTVSTSSPGNNHMPVAKLILSFIVVYTTKRCHKAHCYSSCLASFWILSYGILILDMVSLLSKNISGISLDFLYFIFSPRKNLMFWILPFTTSVHL